MTVVAIISGGLDSTTMAYQLAAEGAGLAALSFDYGQRHARRELPCAVWNVTEIEHRYRRPVPYHVSDLRGLTALLGDSALVDTATDVPEGHYADPSMRATVVPNRNLIMLSIAVGYAVSLGASAVALAVHSGDRAVYPDCRPEFLAAATETFRVANVGFIDPDFRILAPYLDATKEDIARRAVEFGVPIDRTWSCYLAGDVHCGRCGTCVERREAMHLAGVDDPTVYADAGFWRQAVTDFEANRA